MKNKQKLWFKRRRYGYGWTPVTWEGWTTLTVFIISLILASVIFLKEEGKAEPSFILVLILLISINILITYKKGPKPKWRCGKKPDDDPKLDF